MDLPEAFAAVVNPGYRSITMPIWHNHWIINYAIEDQQAESIIYSSDDNEPRNLFRVIYTAANCNKFMTVAITIWHNNNKQIKMLALTVATVRSCKVSPARRRCLVSCGTIVSYTIGREHGCE